MLASDQVQTTIFLELEGRIRHAVSPKPISEIEGLIQAEHLIPVELDGQDIYVQTGSIEYLMEGDQRPEPPRDEAGPPA